MIKWSKRPTIPVMTRRREPLRKCYSAFEILEQSQIEWNYIYKIVVLYSVT